MTKFHIKFECNKEVLADLIAMGLTKDAVVIEMKRAESVPVKQYSFDELKPKVRETQTIAATPVIKRKVKPYTQQTTCWAVYKTIEKHFNPQKVFTCKQVLAICQCDKPNVTYGSVSGHLTRMSKMGLVRLVQSKHEIANHYVVAKLVSKEAFMKLLRQTQPRKVTE